MTCLRNSILFIFTLHYIQTGYSDVKVSQEKPLANNAGFLQFQRMQDLNLKRTETEKGIILIKSLVLYYISLL